jgi:hypothetical protein
MRSRAFLWPMALLISPASHALDQPPAPHPPAFQLRLDPGHPWRPPFGLDRVGRPLRVVVETTQPPRKGRYSILLDYRGKEVGRHDVHFPPKPPYSAAIELGTFGDELRLILEESPGGKPVELVRQPIRPAAIEVESMALPDSVVNPIDLGAILVPTGWLILGPGQSGVLRIAVICRDRDEPGALLRAWFASAPDEVTTAAIPLRVGTVEKRRLALRRRLSFADRDTLHVSLTSAVGKELWHKTTPVMCVLDPPRWPPFGASLTRLRYDAPISVRDPKTGVFSSMKYEDGWDPELKDVVVSLPNGSRFVFWRGSSYIPFWAGRHNTGACYEWAEMLSRPAGAVDCVEPLMDKELRYGRVEIIASTPARVHVRWTYQSTDLHYNVWGDEAVEDYYFYPDGFGTRVLSLKTAPGAEYELSEFILLTPQGTYPFDVLPENLVDALPLDGKKAAFRFPFRPEKDGDPRKAYTTPAIYRLRLGKNDEPSAVYFNPGEVKPPAVVFGLFSDRGEIVTPCYWGSHWPLARGNATGSTIDDRVSLTPCHNSVMSWVAARPESLSVTQHATVDALGRSRVMTTRRWAWLIGMSGADDGTLVSWARSYARPPSVEVRGARLAPDSYIPERRALRIQMQGPSAKIQLRPEPICVNPVFEVEGATKENLAIMRDGRRVADDEFAWDGKVLWLDATIGGPTVLELSFGAAR